MLLGYNPRPMTSVMGAFKQAFVPKFIPPYLKPVFDAIKVERPNDTPVRINETAVLMILQRFYDMFEVELPESEKILRQQQKIADSHPDLDDIQIISIMEVVQTRTRNQNGIFHNHDDPGSFYI